MVHRPAVREARTTPYEAAFLAGKGFSPLPEVERGEAISPARLLPRGSRGDCPIQPADARRGSLLHRLSQAKPRQTNWCQRKGVEAKRSDAVSLASVPSVLFFRNSSAQPAAIIAADSIEKLGNTLACRGFYRVAQLGKGVAPPRTHGVGLLQIRLSVLTVFFVGLKAAVP
jgi:hypothetical protein